MVHFAEIESIKDVDDYTIEVRYTIKSWSLHRRPVIEHRGRSFHFVTNSGNIYTYSTDAEPNQHRCVLQYVLDPKNREIQTLIHMQYGPNVLDVSYEDDGIILHVMEDMSVCRNAPRSFLVIHAGHYTDIRQHLKFIGCVEIDNIMHYVYEVHMKGG